jgi:hypothetical protein
MPWALEHLPPGNTVLLVTSETSPERASAPAHLTQGRFATALLVAGTRDEPSGPDAMRITPQADLAAVLEGRA